MTSLSSSISLKRLSALALVASLALVGCSGDSSVTGAGLESGSVELTADPLDGVLNSTHGSTPAEPGARIDRLAEALGLDEAQKAALASAYEDFHSGLSALKDQVKAGDLDREAGKERAGELRDAFEAEVQTILTEDQWDQLQEMRQNRDGRGHGRRHRGDRWAGWLEAIGADEGQVTAVREAMASLHDGLKGLRDQARDGSISRDDVKAAAMALLETFDAALQNILTAEQYAELQELRPDHQGRRR